MKTTKIIKLVLVISTLLNYDFCQAQTENNTPQKENFEKMANYLTNGSGKWTGENKQYNSDNPRSPKAFGLWFERPMKNLLSLKVVAYLKDTTRLSSQGIFS